MSSDTSPNNPKVYPSATPEVARLFSLNSKPGGVPLPVVELPVADSHASDSAAASDAMSVEPVTSTASASNPGVKIIKASAPYVVVFSLAVFVYFFFFSSSQINIGGLFPAKAQPATPKQTALQQLETQSLAGYQQWIKQFYFDVPDTNITNPEADNSGNGLSNFQKYLLNLNPKAYDTLGLGMPDSQALAQGLNPSTGAALTDDQKQIVDKYFDMEVISNRLTLSHLQGEVAGASINNNNNNNNNYNNNGTGIAGGSNQQFSVRGGSSGADINTNNNFNNTATNNTANNTTASLPVGGFDGADVQIDSSKAGLLSIPSLKISVPVIWTQNTSNFDKDLQSGVVHYPGTAMPGQIGTAYISGHSSNYVWAKGSYNHVFTHLDGLADNTSFSITATLVGGKQAIFHYVVAGRQQYSPTDQAQFKNGGKSVVALSTCWPVGSTAKRLVVFGELTQVEK